MKDGILISVIMPVYNVSKYLKRAVNSVLEQSLDGFEIILTDDGSTDESGEICDKLAADDSRIRVIHKANGGVSSARNEALKIARGKYIYFMDPDDYVIGEVLRDNIEIAEKYDCDEVIFCFYGEILNEKDEPIRRIEYMHNLSGSIKHDIFKSVFTEHMKKVPNSVWNRIYSRRVIGNILFDETVDTAEDALFNNEIIRQGFLNIYYNNKIYYVYSVRDNSLMNKFNPRRMENEMLITDSIKAIVELWGSSEDFDEFFKYRYIEALLCEYGNMLMKDCDMPLKKRINAIKARCNDEYAKKVMSAVKTKDIEDDNLRRLYFLTKHGMYRTAFAFKYMLNNVGTAVYNIKRRFFK